MALGVSKDHGAGIVAVAVLVALKLPVLFQLHVPGIGEVASGGPDAAYRFGHTGLKLVPQSGDRYPFLSCVRYRPT
jgi:hypothetical protein